MRTEREIRAGMNCCANPPMCNECPYEVHQDTLSCVSELIRDTAELIEIKDERIAIMEECKKHAEETMGVCLQERL